tara:strand:- start:420 stop:728 length:309 start_codon:yes stop_codon:yes gene_type:complete
MADTFGDLIDKLTISNIRLWNLEDERRLYSNSKEDKGDEYIKGFLSKVSSTNKERNSLIDQINSSIRVLLDAFTGKESCVVSTVEDLLGTGKNKFYRGEDRK